MSRRALAFLFVAPAMMLSAFVGCEKPIEPAPLTNIEKDYDRPLAPGQFALRRLEPSEYPDFGKGWFKAKGVGLREAIQNSIAYMHKPSSQKYYPLGPITHERVLASLNLFLELLDHADSPERMNQIIAENFDVYMSIGCDDRGTVLFTGYYSPIFDGSVEATEEFRYPLYRLPAEIQKDEEGEVVGGPWNDRQTIEQSGMLAGQEIVWLRDRFEAYVISVQGSGFLRMADGSLMEVGYAGNNGHEYTPIGKMLVADGRIDRSRLSLDKMIAYFKQNPQDLDYYLYQNKRYVFFRDSTGGPYGCLGQRVTPFHSIATDKEIFPRASLAFVQTRIPYEPGNATSRSFDCFVLDQDRGAAIRAPGRTDIYMGVGEDAGKLAGFTYSEGRLFYLIAREGAVAPTSESVVSGGGE